jgi:hypothetical protein
MGRILTRSHQELEVQLHEAMAQLERAAEGQRRAEEAQSQAESALAQAQSTAANDAILVRAGQEFGQQEILRLTEKLASATKFRGELTKLVLREELPANVEEQEVIAAVSRLVERHRAVAERLGVSDKDLDAALDRLLEQHLPARG